MLPRLVIPNRLCAVDCSQVRRPVVSFSSRSRDNDGWIELSLRRGAVGKESCWDFLALASSRVQGWAEWVGWVGEVAAPPGPWLVGPGRQGDMGG